MNETLYPVKGSVYSGSYSSYSGADIKILVNLYKNYKFKTGTKQQVQQRKNLYTEENRIARSIALTNKKLKQERTGTPGATRLQRKRSKLLKNKKKIRDLITAQDSPENKAGKMQNNPPTKVLAEAQTISYSSHRPKVPVRALGAVYPKGYTRGSRNIAGSLIFTVFNEHVFYELMEAHPSDFDGHTLTSAVLDQLPPVDILVSFASEYGSVSRMTFRGVEFTDEGQTMSIEDMLTEQVVHWVARDFDPMRAVSQRKLDSNSRMMQVEQMKRASDLILEEDFKEVKNYLDPFSRFSTRRNPYQ